MARWVEVRSASSYERDIGTLRRLRTAIAIDSSLDMARRSAATECLDKIISLVQAFARELESNPRE
jgi:hypothetical protein